MNSVVRARIDEKVKDEAAVVLEAVGLTVSDAFRLMLHRIVMEQKLPFEPLIPNAETIAAMKDARKPGGKGVKTAKDLWAALDAEDDKVDVAVQKRPQARAKRSPRRATRKAA